MQTFLAYQSFIDSAKCLDYRRLGKQRVEAWQIYQAITQPEYGWKNHPIVKMWYDYPQALLLYGIEICNEWLRRGYKDTMLARFQNELHNNIILPSWLGNQQLHDSHKSNLLRKDYNWYKQFNWNIPDNLEYVWIIK